MHADHAEAYDKAARAYERLINASYCSASAYQHDTEVMGFGFWRCPCAYPSFPQLEEARL